MNEENNVSLAREIFELAISIEFSKERAAFVSNKCGRDAALLVKVQALLKAHDEAVDQETGLFQSGGDNQDDIRFDVANDGGATRAPDNPSLEKEGQILAGKYKLRQNIGEGGMGSVWVAEQLQPVKRKVAIKLVKAGMDSKQVLARFEAERQALAVMDHPNIAKVFDGGMTEQGRPFFVMEYVKGIPFTKYCDQARVPLRERLELVIPVCQAIQHAHQKGIVHRDLKPSNILICLYDGKPVPKVIDFGLAKALHQPLTEHSIFTGHGMMVGTPLYMSPEQAELNNLDVDTRTDIYSLGVMLYELLTGTTPLEKAQFKEAAFNEVLRIIKEVEPPRPSTRLSGSDTLPSIAAQRNIEPKQLCKSLSGELDWIVMRALEKDRSRRYETPSSLSDDISAYLNGDPINAAPPSRRYRLQKFIRKNRTQVVAATVVMLLLLLGLAGTTWGLFQAQIAQRKTDTALQQASKERDAKSEALNAKSQALDAEKIQRARVEEQRRIAETNLTSGIIRPIGFGGDRNKLNGAEFQSFKDWSQLPSSRLKLLVLKQALSKPESALRLARRSERATQAGVGTSLSRRSLAIEQLNRLQADEEVDLQIEFAACTLAMQLDDRQLPEFENVLIRILEHIDELPAPLTGRDVKIFIAQWVELTSSSNQFDRVLPTLTEIAEKTEDSDVLFVVAKEMAELTPYLKEDQVDPVLATLIKVIGNTEDSDALAAAGAGVAALTRKSPVDQIDPALTALIEIVRKTEGEVAIEAASEGIAALAPRLKVDQIDRILVSLIEVVKKTDQPETLYCTAKKMATLASHLNKDQFDIVLVSLTEIVRKTDQDNPLYGVANGIAKLAPFLNGDQTNRAFVLLSEITDETDDSVILVAATKEMVALAPHLKSYMSQPACPFRFPFRFPTCPFRFPFRFSPFSVFLFGFPPFRFSFSVFLFGFVLFGFAAVRPDYRAACPRKPAECGLL